MAVEWIDVCTESAEDLAIKILGLIDEGKISVAAQWYQGQGSGIYVDSLSNPSEVKYFFY